MCPPITAFRRSLTTTPRFLVNVPPESPKFIEVPTVRLRRPCPPPRAKGFIPKPKNLFPPSKPDKGTPPYLAAATPEPSRPLAPPTDGSTATYQQWKSAMATKRRENLRTGLAELRKRKEENEARVREARRERNERRQIALQAAERDDVRLTMPSVLSVLKIDSGKLQDPYREERLRRMRENVARHERAKKGERKEQVVKLYMEAKNFIVNERQLDEAIEKVFGDDTADVRVRWPTIEEMFIEKQRRESKAGLFGLLEDGVGQEVFSTLAGGPVGKKKQAGMGDVI